MQGPEGGDGEEDGHLAGLVRSKALYMADVTGASGRGGSHADTNGCHEGYEQSAGGVEHSNEVTSDGHGTGGAVNIMERRMWTGHKSTVMMAMAASSTTFERDQLCRCSIYAPLLLPMNFRASTMYVKIPAAR